MGIHHRQFLDFVFLQNFRGSIQIGRLARGNQSVFGHYFVDPLFHFALETQIAVGNNSHQRVIFRHHRNAANFVLSHHSQRIGNRFFGMNADGIQYHTVFGTFHGAHLLCLIVNGHIFVDNADAAFARNSDSHSGFGNGVHCGRHHGDVERNVSGKARGEIYVAGENFGITGD